MRRWLHFLLLLLAATAFARVPASAAYSSSTPAGHLVAEMKDRATPRYGYDGHGSTRFLTAKHDATTDTYTYVAFGNSIAPTPTHGSQRPIGGSFCGERDGAGLGWCHRRARHLNPNTDRFWAMDAYARSSTDPSRLHKYLYAHGNPVNRVDPSGHESLLSLSIASSLGMSLRLGYDTTTTAAGAAIQKTIFGVQAGKTAEAIVAEYAFETTVAVGMGFVLSKVLGRALDLDGLGSNPLTAAEEARFVPFKPKVGTRVYRVIGPGGNPYGRSWTTVDPRKVKNYADAAGLAPDHAIYQGEAMLVEGEIIGTEGILIGPAENSLAIPARYGGGPGNAGGLLELRINDAAKSVRFTKPAEPFSVQPFHP